MAITFHNTSDVDRQSGFRFQADVPRGSLAVQESYAVSRKDERGNWSEEARFHDETEAVLYARQVERAYPFDIVTISPEYD